MLPARANPAVGIGIAILQREIPSKRRTRMQFTTRDEGYVEDSDFNDRGSTRNRARRGSGQDYRGYTRGYNMNREPNYRTEYDRSTTGWGAADYGRGNYPRENYERDYSD